MAAGGLALVLALGGYGVTQAATSTSTTATAGAAGTARPPGMSGAGTSGSSAPSGPPPSGSRGGPAGGLGAASKGGTGGKVTTISGDTITLTTMADKTVTVTVTPSTVFKDGSTTSTQSALKKGDIAMVSGSTSSDGTVTATTVTFGNAPNGAPGTPPSGA